MPRAHDGEFAPAEQRRALRKNGMSGDANFGFHVLIFLAAIASMRLYRRPVRPEPSATHILLRRATPNSTAAPRARKFGAIPRRPKPFFLRNSRHLLCEVSTYPAVAGFPSCFRDRSPVGCKVLSNMLGKPCKLIRLGKVKYLDIFFQMRIIIAVDNGSECRPRCAN